MNELQTDLEPVDLEVGRKLAPGEHDYRLKLFDRCRYGEPKAVADLARVYEARIWTFNEIDNYNASVEATE